MMVRRVGARTVMCGPFLRLGHGMGYYLGEGNLKRYDYEMVYFE